MGLGEEKESGRARRNAEIVRMDHHLITHFAPDNKVDGREPCLPLLSKSNLRSYGPRFSSIRRRSLGSFSSGPAYSHTQRRSSGGGP
jgi:hypothetical protein